MRQNQGYKQQIFNHFIKIKIEDVELSLIFPLIKILFGKMLIKLKLINMLINVNINKS